jgi:hypothetical protein
MPPVVIWVASAIGVFVAAKWIARETRRINLELHPVRPEPAEAARPTARLRRDAHGVYRPE